MLNGDAACETQALPPLPHQRWLCSFLDVCEDSSRLDHELPNVFHGTQVWYYQVWHTWRQNSQWLCWHTTLWYWWLVRCLGLLFLC